MFLTCPYRPAGSLGGPVKHIANTYWTTKTKTTTLNEEDEDDRSPSDKDSKVLARSHTLNCQVSRRDRAIVDSHGTAGVDTLVLKLRVDDVQTSLASTRQLAR